MNYSTLLDWYVWYCFMYVILSMAEFTVVSSLLQSKNTDPLLGELVDDFSQWTIGPVWLLTNLIFWPPLLGSDGARAFFWLLAFFWVGLNLYRVYWNYGQKKKGFRAAFLRSVEWGREHILRKRHTTIVLDNEKSDTAALRTLVNPSASPASGEEQKQDSDVQASVVVTHDYTDPKTIVDYGIDNEEPHDHELEINPFETVDDSIDLSRK